MRKKDDKKKHEALMQLQMLDAQIKQFEQQIMQIEEQIMEVNMVVSSLSELNEVKKDTELLAPIANGIFANAKLTDSGKLKVNVGAGVFVEKTVKETQDMLTGQLKNIEGYKDQLFAQLQQMISSAGLLQKELSM